MDSQPRPQEAFIWETSGKETDTLMNRSFATFRKLFGNLTREGMTPRTSSIV
jgi:hypothetical protein